MNECPQPRRNLKKNAASVAYTATGEICSNIIANIPRDTSWTMWRLYMFPNRIKIQLAKKNFPRRTPNLARGMTTNTTMWTLCTTTNNKWGNWGGRGWGRQNRSKGLPTAVDGRQGRRFRAAGKQEWHRFKDGDSLIQQRKKPSTCHDRKYCGLQLLDRVTGRNPGDDYILKQVARHMHGNETRWKKYTKFFWAVFV